MATINSAIPMGVQPVRIEDPLNKLAQAYQVQGLQRQGEMADMQMQQARQGMERQNKLRELLGGFQQGVTPEQQAAELTRGGFLTEAQTVSKTAAENSKMSREAEKARLEALKQKIEIGGQILGSVTDPNSYQRARQVAAQAGFDPWPEQYDPAWVAQQTQQGMTLKDRVDAAWRQTQNATTIRGQDITMRGQDMSDARARDRLSYDKTNINRKPMTAAQEAKYREEIAKDYQAANTNLANMNEVLKSIEAVRNSPGLSRATGVMAYAPSIPGGEAAAAEIRLKNLEGKITQLGKAAAAQGGAIGPMAVQEWKIVRDMIAAIDPKKGKQAMLDQIDLIENSVLGATERIKDVYSKQYSPDADLYPQFQELKDHSRSNRLLSAQDKEAMDWANANPNDPRAAKIKERLGAK